MTRPAPSPARRARRSIHALLAIAATAATAALALVPSAARAQRAQESGSAPPPSYPALGQEIVELVRSQFFDAARGAAWAEANDRYAREIADGAAFARETNARLDRLGASHTRYFSPDDPGHAEISSIFEAVSGRPVAVDSLGLGLAAAGGEWFVARVFAGGPAEKAGLLRGDRIAALDGRPFEPVRSLRGKAGTPVVLEVERRRGAARVEVSVTPARVDPKVEWLAALESGTKTYERRGRKVGYLPVWSCAGDAVRQEIEEQATGAVSEADALVLDFRGGWGGCSPQLVQLFVPAPPAMVSIDRDGVRRRYPPAWEKPLVVLVDFGSRSGKELVARALQRLGRATLVGERTGGAVLAGRFLPLSDGSVLYLAVQDVLVDGERLEGVGVQPDVPVAAPLPFAEGRDPQLDAALDRAAELAARSAPLPPA